MYFMFPMLNSSPQKLDGRHHDLVLTVTKNLYLKYQWIFYVVRIFFLSSITAYNLTGLTEYMSNTVRIL